MSQSSSVTREIVEERSRNLLGRPMPERERRRRFGARKGLESVRAVNELPMNLRVRPSSVLKCSAISTRHSCKIEDGRWR